ncbi:MAG: helix-turn-helix domain-containing protein [Pikeienuella sp.]|uniref:helix-turn-helix domain-containing protein n=1 Tax=Pikeienuella sp. TaxID=2831957 RepID=UPI00391C5B6A
MRTAFGEMLGAELRKRNMTQSDLARAANVGKDRISYYVRGGQPRPKTLQKLAKALGMTLEHMQTAIKEAEDAAIPLTKPTDHDSSNFSILETERPGWMAVRFIGILPRQAALRVATAIGEAQEEAERLGAAPTGGTTKTS